MKELYNSTFTTTPNVHMKRFPSITMTAERQITVISFQSLEWWLQRKWGLLGFWEMGTHVCDWQKPPWGNSTTALQSSEQASHRTPHSHFFVCSQRTETDLSGFYTSGRWLHSKGQAEIRQMPVVEGITLSHTHMVGHNIATSVLLFNFHDISL